MDVVAIQGELQVRVGCGFEAGLLLAGDAGEGPAQGEGAGGAEVELEGGAFRAFLEGQAGGGSRGGWKGAGGEQP